MMVNKQIKHMLESWKNLGFPVITPHPDPRDIQPASVDVYIDPESIKVWTGPMMHSHNPSQDRGFWQSVKPYWQSDPDKGERFVIIFKPDCLYLMATKEYFSIPTDVVGFLHGVSTNARMGFVPHQQAGLLDPGWEGVVTGEATFVTWLEMTFEWPDNKQFRPPRMGQVTFEHCSRDADPAYKGRYQGDVQATTARTPIGG